MEIGKKKSLNDKEENHWFSAAIPFFHKDDEEERQKKFKSECSSSTLMKSTFIFQAQMGSLLDDVVVGKKKVFLVPEGKSSSRCRKKGRWLLHSTTARYTSLKMLLLSWICKHWSWRKFRSAPAALLLNCVVWTRSASVAFALSLALWKAALFESEFAARYLFVWAAM